MCANDVWSTYVLCQLCSVNVAHTDILLQYANVAHTHMLLQYKLIGLRLNYLFALADRFTSKQLSSVLFGTCSSSLLQQLPNDMASARIGIGRLHYCPSST